MLLLKSLRFLCMWIWRSSWWLTLRISQGCCLVRSKPDCHLPLPSSQATSGNSWLVRRGHTWNVGDMAGLLQQWLLSQASVSLGVWEHLGLWVRTWLAWSSKVLGCLYVTHQHRGSAQEKALSAFHSWKGWLRAAVCYSPFPSLPMPANINPVLKQLLPWTWMSNSPLLPVSGDLLHISFVTVR